MQSSALAGEIPLREKNIRQDLILNNYLRYREFRDSLNEDWKQIEQAVQELGVEAAFQDETLAAFFEKFRVLNNKNKTPILAYFGKAVDEDAETLNLSRIRSKRRGRSLNVADVAAIWSGLGFSISDSFNVGMTEVYLDGVLPVAILGKIDEYLKKQENVIAEADGKYKLYSYYQHHDFRIALGLRVCARAFGRVRSV